MTNDQPIIKELFSPTDAGMTDPASLEYIYREMEKAEPELWRRCYPRIYRDYKPNQYYSPKSVGRQIMNCALKIEMGFFGQSESYEIIWASQMANQRCPMYWVAEDLAKAVVQTVPPVELDWYKMKMPHPAAAFMLPKGLLVHPKEGDASFVSYTRNTAGQWIPGVNRRGRAAKWASQNGAMTIFAKTEIKPGASGGFFTHWNIPYDVYPVVNLAKLDDLVMRHEQEKHSSGWLSTPEMTHDDTIFGGQAAHLIFGLLLLMLRKPEILTSGVLEKRVKGEAGQPPKEFWSPNVLGMNYKIRRIGLRHGGTHASPRFHWVRGFWKEQPHGPQNSLRKDVWIEPYERGLEDDSESAVAAK